MSSFDPGIVAEATSLRQKMTKATSLRHLGGFTIMEKYELPIKFTEEERAAYATWGIKKEKVLVPFGIAAGLIYLLAAVCIITRVWGIREHDSLLFHILIQSGWVEEAGYVLAILCTILLLGPINWILDKVWKKPVDPKWLRIAIVEENVKVSLLQEAKNNRESVAEIYPLSNLSVFLNSKENTVFFQGKWIEIGENTIENIYPSEKQHAWMDYPTRKVSAISNVKKIEDILKGYEASLEAICKEQEWIKKHQ